MNGELKAWIECVSRNALVRPMTTFATFALAMDTLDREIPGDFVECGVYRGSQCAVMAKALMLRGDGERRVHLFDSFSGLPAPSVEDPELRGHIPDAGYIACSEDQVRSNMEAWGIPENLLVYHAGWFKETMPVSRINEIALLRLDADLYESTRESMEYMYPKLAPGAWCICDDYNFSGCRKAIHQVLMPQPIYWQKGAGQ